MIIAIIIIFIIIFIISSSKYNESQRWRARQARWLGPSKVCRSHFTLLQKCKPPSWPLSILQVFVDVVALPPRAKLQPHSFTHSLTIFAASLIQTAHQTAHLERRLDGSAMACRLLLRSLLLVAGESRSEPKSNEIISECDRPDWNKPRGAEAEPLSSNSIGDSQDGAPIWDRG